MDLMEFGPEKIRKVWTEEKGAIRKVQACVACSLRRRSSDLMPLCMSHAYFQEWRGESRKSDTCVCHQTPWGHLCVFWRSRAMQLSGHVYERDSSALPRPQFRTRGWGAPLSLTQFLNFLLYCDEKLMKAHSVLFQRLGSVVEVSSQMWGALCRGDGCSCPWLAQMEEDSSSVWLQSLYFSLWSWNVA